MADPAKTTAEDGGDLAAARELARLCIAARTAAAGRAANAARLLIAAAKGTVEHCAITDAAKLLAIAGLRGIKTERRATAEIAVELGEAVLAELGKRDACVTYAAPIPAGRRKLWEALRSSRPESQLDVDACGDPAALLRAAECAAIENGWGASLLVIEMNDVLLGTPSPRRCEIRADGATVEAVAGFGAEAIARMLGGEFRASLMPLAENIAKGTVRGVAAIFGPAFSTEETWVRVAEDLAKGNVLTLAAGGPAFACARAGLMLPEAADRAGSGLRELCDAVGCPPVLHVGSFEETPRILMLIAKLVEEADVRDFSDLPIAAVCADTPRRDGLPMGQCFVASGIRTVNTGEFGADAGRVARTVREWVKNPTPCPLPKDGEGR